VELHDDRGRNGHNPILSHVLSECAFEAHLGPNSAHIPCRTAGYIAHLPSARMTQGWRGDFYVYE
jgi:hypothetical protein